MKNVITPAAVFRILHKALCAWLSRRMRRKESPTAWSGISMSVSGDNYRLGACLNPAGMNCRKRCIRNRRRWDYMHALCLPTSSISEKETERALIRCVSNILGQVFNVYFSFCFAILPLWPALYASKKIQRDVVAPVALFDLPYFLLGQSLAQLSQFSLSSFSNPKGIISPHWQAHPRSVDSSRRLSQKGQHNIGPLLIHDTFCLLHPI